MRQRPRQGLLVSYVCNLVCQMSSDLSQPLGLSQPSRNFAASSSKVSVTQATRTLTSRKPHSNPEVKRLEEPTVDFSGEDNCAEQEAILKSPPKGMKRLSSEVRISFNTCHLLIDIVGHR